MALVLALIGTITVLGDCGPAASAAPGMANLPRHAGGSADPFTLEVWPLFAERECAILAALNETESEDSPDSEDGVVSCRIADDSPAIALRGGMRACPGGGSSWGTVTRSRIMRC
jgi:hypothetical protein